MRKSVKILLAALLLAPLVLPLSGCGCGFDCNNGNDNDNNGPAVLTLGLSDSVPEDLKQVVIEVDSITFRRSGAEDVVVDSFTIDDEVLTTFQVDLLKYRGLHQLIVIENLELNPGLYNELLITILSGDINLSFVQEADDSLKEITVPTAGLSVPGMDLSSGKAVFTVEFNLAQALQFQESADKYLLATDGVRVENNETAASLSGQVDSSLFDSVSPCDEKTNPDRGNRIYLYQGVGLSDRLSDVFTSNSGTDVPADVLAPFAVASLLENTFTGGWEYAFGYLPAGDYTMAFACDTGDDDAVDFDDLVVALPTDQVYEITLSEAERAVCNLGEGASC